MNRILFLLIIPVFVFAMGNINGYLHDSTTGEPLIYANVMLANTNYGTASDVHGYYVIPGVPAGDRKSVV